MDGAGAAWRARELGEDVFLSGSRGTVMVTAVQRGVVWVLPFYYVIPWDKGSECYQELLLVKDYRVLIVRASW